jgi:hypothetical protein
VYLIRRIALTIGAVSASAGLLAAAYSVDSAWAGVALSFLAIAIPTRAAFYLEGAPFWPRFVTKLARRLG